MDSLSRKDTGGFEKTKISQYVIFFISTEVFGINVLKVHEIVGMTKITHVPNSVNFMKGIINPRGKVIPVGDMRLKFVMEEMEYNVNTEIIIVEFRDKLTGMVVDTVPYVMGLPDTTIHDTPHFSVKIETDIMKRVSTRDNEMIIILAVEKILTHEEAAGLDEKKIA